MITTTLMILISLHLLMGAFDTLWHHELQEKLAWRTSQHHELKLHGSRNIFYAFIYLCFGVITPAGLWAWLFAAIVIVELIITLVDFVEEDNSRKLPASERVLHTILALNFGAILALLLPRLWVLSANGSQLTVTWTPWWSLICVTVSVLALIMAIRDLHASGRLKRMLDKPVSPLLSPTAKRKSVLITGATGFIGNALTNALQTAGHEVIALTRAIENAGALKAPVTIITDLEQLPNATNIDVIINLAGATTAALWTPKYKDQMLDSRLETTRQLTELITRLNKKPELLVSGSAIGIYGVKPVDTSEEDHPAELDGSFSQTLCQLWEAKAAAATEHGVRVVMLRMGMVIDTSGGPLAAMLVPTELGGGATFGDGSQHMSWITREDLIRLVGHIITDESIEGPINAVAPKPVRNQEFVRSLAKHLSRPSLIRIPEFVFTRLLGEFGKEIILADQDVLPIKAIMHGFEFNHPDIHTAFEDLLAFQNTRDNKAHYSKTVL